MGPPSQPDFEGFFHASSLDLVIPEHSSIQSSAQASARGGSQRHVAFLGASPTPPYLHGVGLMTDEKLTYFVSLSVPDEVLSPEASKQKEPPAELLRYLSRLQVSTVPLCYLEPAPQSLERGLQNSLRCLRLSFPL